MQDLINQLNDLPTGALEVRVADVERTPDTDAPICACTCGCSK